MEARRTDAATAAPASPRRREASKANLRSRSAPTASFSSSDATRAVVPWVGASAVAVSAPPAKEKRAAVTASTAPSNEYSTSPKVAARAPPSARTTVVSTVPTLARNVLEEIFVVEASVGAEASSVGAEASVVEASGSSAASAPKRSVRFFSKKSSKSSALRESKVTSALETWASTVSSRKATRQWFASSSAAPFRRPTAAALASASTTKVLFVSPRSPRTERSRTVHVRSSSSSAARSRASREKAPENQSTFTRRPAAVADDNGPPETRQTLEAATSTTFLAVTSTRTPSTATTRGALAFKLRNNSSRATPSTETRAANPSFADVDVSEAPAKDGLSAADAFFLRRTPPSRSENFDDLDDLNFGSSSSSSFEGSSSS
mmetsp:Transcript_36339/g.116431  ORF Transcript_36339/g.116431 Transcript_36339/m.116431 type:complete len:378 (+) Transcript_36339:688-1821(+)